MTYARWRKQGVFGGLSLLLWFFGCGPTYFPVSVAVVTDNDHQLKTGSPKADIIYFLDLQCPACRRFTLTEYPSIKKDFLETGMIRWIVRHRPIPEVHERAVPAAQAAECAAEKGLFFEYIELALTNQADLSLEALVKYAVELKIDKAFFESCVKTEKYKEKVALQMKDADANKVTFTPMFVNGTRGVGRADLRRLIEEALKK